MDWSELSTKLSRQVAELIVLALPVVLAYAFKVARSYALVQIDKLRAQAETIKDDRVRDLLAVAADEAVNAVEGTLKDAGPDVKRFEAIGLVNDYLKDRGVEVDYDLVAMTVEAQVFQQFNKTVGDKAG